MAKVRPFRAVRPAKDKASLVATRPIKSYSKQALKNKLETNPYTFLRIINPEFDTIVKTDANSIERFRLISEKYNDFKEEGILLKDDDLSFYIYQQSIDNHVFTGIISCLSTQDYIDNIIKIHEKTLTRREEMFTKYLHTCGFNAEPVLMTFEDLNNQISFLMEHEKQKQLPEFNFTTTDTVNHKLWMISDRQTIQNIERIFETIPHIYIADGHHRSASSANLAQLDPSNKAYQGFLAYLLPETQLVIKPFHRAVLNLKGKSVQDILNYLKTHGFKVEERRFEQEDIKPSVLGLLIEDKHYLARITFDKNDLTDVEIISEKLLFPLFDIANIETNKDIVFIEASELFENIEHRVKEGVYKMAIIVSAVNIEDIKRVADNQCTMPPKSTYILPKLRNGLVIYDFSVV